MQIGAVARKIGLSVDAIPFYDRNSRLPRPPRTQGGFRQYAEGDVETLAFIRRVQGLGFRLREIRGRFVATTCNLAPRCAAACKKSWARQGVQAEIAEVLVTDERTAHDAILYAPRERCGNRLASVFWSGPVFRVIPGLEKALADQP